MTPASIYALELRHAYIAGKAHIVNAQETYKDEYSKAENELKKSAVRTKRGEQLKTVLRSKRAFDNWVATVKEMNTTSNGKAYFSVVAPEK